MSEINRIYVNSSLTVESGYNNTLCFVDGRLIDKSRYTLENNELSIYREAVNYISTFYSANVSKTYYFEKTLDDFGIVVFGKDKQGNTLTNLRNNNNMVFVDGVLLKKSEYRILDSGNIALLIIKNDSSFHEITIFVSTGEIANGIIDDPTNTHTFILDEYGEKVRINNPNNNIGYSKENTLVFQNGKLIEPTRLKTVDGYTSTTFIPEGGISRDVIKQDYFIDMDYGDKFEYYKFSDNTRSINFEATHGVTTYGPKDDYGVEIPLLYDSSVLFDDLVKTLVDDLRPGFIIYEKDRAGKLLIVDTEYESRRIKTLTLEPFSAQIYSKDEYYLEVPEAKSIIDYLSDYDKKFTMLPEILRVFQRVILDEIHDEINRVKNIRNIKTVDSAHVHKLISLLGMDLDIKHLNIKQMQEAMEELTGFYRIVGTKNSLNYFNIVQDNTKLINIKQLFTFHKTKDKSQDAEKIYSYNYSLFQSGGVTYGGHGYLKDEQYRLISQNEEDTGIVLTVTNTGPNGSLIDGGFRTNTQEGKQAFSTSPLQLKTNSTGAVLKCDSIPYIYNYSANVTSGAQGGFHTGDILTTPLYDGYITVTANQQGQITGATLSKTTGTTSYSNIKNTPLQFKMTTAATQTAGSSLTNITVVTATFETQITAQGDYVFSYDGSDWSLNGNTVNMASYGISYSGTPVDGDEITVSYRSSSNLQLFINAKDNTVQEVHRSTKTGNGRYDVPETAIYEITISGAGGSGGAADTSIGSTNDSPASSGYNGEEITRRIVCSKGTSITYTIGEGGKASWAKGHDGARAGAGGSGASNGKMGYTKTNNIEQTSGGWHYTHGGIFKKWHSQHWIWDTYTVNGTATNNQIVHSRAASGAGGGGSSFSYNGSSWTAKGGDGGTATWASKNNSNDVVLQGGVGGYGGTKIGTGAKGGARNPNDSSFTSKDGSGGYIIIRKITQDYVTNAQLLNNVNTGINVGAKLKTTDNWFDIKVDQVVGGRVTKFTLTPTIGAKPIYTSKQNGEIIDYKRTFDLINTTKEAKLTINQTVNTYKYQLTIDTKGGTYVPNQTLTDDLGIFTINIEEIDKSVSGYGKIKTFTYSPTQGNENINFENITLTSSAGEDAYIVIESTADVNIQNVEREYVDFYLPEEQGAVWQKEYRFPVLDYGYVNQGSPGSPWPWIPGDADIDYGTVTQDSPNAPYPYIDSGSETVHIHDAGGVYDFDKTINYKSPIGNPDIDYGLVSEKIKGKWVEWMDWERPSDLYPTNHVEVEINILSVENYEEAMTRFYKQFYNLASAVLYIHRLITVYNFGNNTTANITSDNPVPGDSLILMGMMTTQPFEEEIHVLTSEAIDVGITQNLNVLHHPEDLYEAFVREHFVVEGVFQIEECCRYFNITLNSAKALDEKWGLTNPEEEFGDRDLGYISENVELIYDWGLIGDNVTEIRDLGTINQGE